TPSRAQRPGLAQERALRPGLPHLDGHGEGLLGRAFLRAAPPLHAEAHPRLRRGGQRHGEGGSRCAGGRLGEGLQRGREDLVPDQRAAPERGAALGLEEEAPMSESTVPLTIVERTARATPDVVARRVRGLSDRAIAWLFISPTIVLLLAINIF